jgi:hypothetical protein
VRPSSTLRSLAREKPPVVDPVGILRGFTGGLREQGAPGERCEMCAVPDHRLLCTCRPCYLLFNAEAASRGHYRAVPENYRINKDFSMSSAQWESLGIPVNLAFLFQQTDQAKHVAFYPSPGGATESLLDLASWDEVVAADPLLGGLIPDVEAVLLRRQDDGFECYLVPIDSCYELVGIVRQYWEGFAGGEEVWARIDEFFSQLRERCRG